MPREGAALVPRDDKKERVVVRKGRLPLGMTKRGG
jgi:hypothetical protein